MEHFEFVFDDEPLDHILYGVGSSGPSSANLYSAGKLYILKIDEAYRLGDIEKIIKLASSFSADKYPLSLQMCCRLAEILTAIIPPAPKSILQYDLSGLGQIQENIWEISLKREAKETKVEIGSSLYRWYEHYERFADARKILCVLIDEMRKIKDWGNEAVFINNFGFEYLLEGKWQKALPSFEKAASMFSAHGDKINYANARANYLTCQIEIDNFKPTEDFITELESQQKTLIHYSDWRVRKLLIIRAKIEERRGNLSEAICLVEQAIKAGQNSKTKYPEIDAAYLKMLSRAILKNRC